MTEKEAAKKLMNELKAIEDQILECEAVLKAVWYFESIII
jgi:hypothetical protein